MDAKMKKFYLSSNKKNFKDINAEVIEAVRKSSCKMARSFVKRGTKINTEDSLGIIPMDYARNNFKMEMFFFLKEKGGKSGNYQKNKNRKFKI